MRHVDFAENEKFNNDQMYKGLQFLLDRAEKDEPKGEMDATYWAAGIQGLKEVIKGMDN